MRARSFLILGTFAAAGCAEGAMMAERPDARGSSSDSGADDASGDSDAPGTDAPPMLAGVQLLLSEIVLAPSTGELIEISNPTASAVDLSTYYLSDAGAYFRTPAGGLTLDSGDFVAKFPTGASIPANGVITVALDSVASFTTAYGSPPTFALSALTIIASTGVSTLTNGGELVVLFAWDGASDTVRDVDMVLAGVPSAANGILDKSNVAVDGPDADSAGTAYRMDARTLAAQPSAPPSAKSTKRISLEATHELHTGTGNGITGDDETSENTAQTWDTVFGPPTPGAVPSGLM